MLQTLSNHDRYLNTPVEPMHLIKNIVEHIVRLVSGAEDSHKVRREEKSRGRFSGAWVAHKKNQLPSAPFRLTFDEVKIANCRACSIQVPKGFGWKPKTLFHTNVTGMMSHSWKQLVCTSILKYCIRGLLGQQQRQTLFLFCNVLARLCAETVHATLLQQLELDVHQALSLLERDFPVSLHVCVFHLLHHLPLFLSRFGPLHAYWMFPFKRFNSWVIRRVHNRRYPESTVVETYKLFEWAHFLQKSSGLPDESVVLPTVYDDDDDVDADKDFHLLCRKGRHTSLGPSEFANLQAQYSPELHCKLSPEVTKYDWHNSTGDFYRRRRFTSIAGDSRLSVSSYIYWRLADSSVVYGRIHFFFKHSLSNDMYAYVKWFNKPARELESGLLFVYLDSVSSCNPVICVCDLSGPVVTAVDLDTPNKLWILSDYL